MNRFSRSFYELLGSLPFLLLVLNSSCEGVDGRSEPEPNKDTPSPSESLKESFEKLRNDPALKNGRIAFYAEDLGTDESLLAHRAREMFVPASTQKLVTTIAALEFLGPDHRFHSYFGYRGRIEDGVLHGDLILKGGGDPAFLSEEFEDAYPSPEELFGGMAASIRDRGIERIEGRFLVDARYFARNSLSRGRIWEDMGNYFGAYPSGMNIMDNSFKLRFDVPEKEGEQAVITKMEPKIPGLEVESRVKASKVREDRAYIFGKPYDSHRSVEGTLPKGRSSYTIEGSMPDPAGFCAWKAHETLENEGLSIAEGYGTFRTEDVRNLGIGTVLDSFSSPPLRKLVEVINYESKNLFAESLLLEMGKRSADAIKPRPAASALMERLKEERIDTSGIRMEDGSGLAPTNRLSAKALVRLLKKAWNGPHRGIIRRSLPRAGRNSTLRYFGNDTPIEGRIWAKSGSMKQVRAYAGYAKKDEGEWTAFAILANDYACDGSEMREKIEPVLSEMIE